MTTGAATFTLMEKAALDTGFDLGGTRVGDRIAFTSSKAPLRLWLTAPGKHEVIAARSLLARRWVAWHAPDMPRRRAAPRTPHSPADTTWTTP